MNEKIFDNTNVGEWLDCLFEEEESGEMFLVEFRKEKGESEEDFIAKCQEVADENFSCPVFQKIVDLETAEIMGYDTY